jgi:hypothetical protein
VILYPPCPNFINLLLILAIKQYIIKYFHSQVIIMAERNPKHLETALFHAKKIEEQKVLEFQILDDLEKLIDYPKNPDTTADSPQPDDIENVTSLLQLFRLGDYDDLIEERRIDNKCCYILCPKPPSRPKDVSGRKILFKNNGDIYTMPADKYYVWCSPECSKRSDYLRSQIERADSWSRALKHYEFVVGDLNDRKTMKYDPQKAAAVETLSNQMAGMGIKDDSDSKNSQPIDKLMSDMVIEKTPANPPTVPEADIYQNNHDIIEGYRPGEGVSLMRDDPLSFMD